MLLKLANHKEVSRFSDHLIQLLLMNKPIATLPLGLEIMKDQLSFLLMKEPLDKCSVNQNQDSVYSINKDQAFYLMPSLKVLKLPEPQVHN